MGGAMKLALYLSLTLGIVSSFIICKDCYEETQYGYHVVTIRDGTIKEYDCVRYIPEQKLGVVCSNGSYTTPRISFRTATEISYSRSKEAKLTWTGNFAKK